MTRRGAEHAHVWRPDGVPGVELFEATYVRHTFARHAHDAIAVGVVNDGYGELWYRGAIHGATADTLVLVPAGEAHTGGVGRRARRPDEAPLVYQMLYVDVACAAALAGEAAARATFADPAPRDPALAALVRRAFHAVRTAPTRLEREAAIADVLCGVVARHGARGPDPRAGREPDAVARVRAYLHDHVGADVSLGDLAALTGLHPAYLTRVFSAAVGLPPHAYHTHLRVERARALLAAGEPPSAVAWATGFADQSHLNRHFRRAVGVPPGRYRSLVAPRRAV